MDAMGKFSSSPRPGDAASHDQALERLDGGESNNTSRIVSKNNDLSRAA